MFKKTLAAVAVLGAFAGSAMAANVTLYGVVDEALQYNYSKTMGGDKVDSYGLKSGAQAGSRWGLKGTEELGNGLVAGFQLESGFNADEGKSAQGGRLFGRVARVYLTGDFGTLSAGRDGALVSGLGSVSYIYNYVALGTGWGDSTGSQGLYNFGYQDRANNSLTYVTPNFGGFTAYAQYSFAADAQEEASANDNNRYAALGAKYDMGAFSTGLVVDYLMKSEKPVADPSNLKAPKVDEDRDDQYTVSYGASYDFGVAKVMGMVQYGKHMDSVVNNFSISHTGKNELGDDYKYKTTGLAVGDFEGYNLGLGVSAPVLGGTAFAQVNYIHAKDKDQDADQKVDGYGFGAAYSYPLSKRTSVYTYGSYGQFKTKGEDFGEDDGAKSKVGEFGVGMTHRF